MRANGLIKRNFLEQIRDPLTLLLGIVFPSILLLIFIGIGKSAPDVNQMFAPENIAPGVLVLGFSLNMMFSAMQINGDKTSSLFSRLQTLPLKSSDFVLAYAIPFIPITLIQTAILYIIAFCFGMPFTGGAFLSILCVLPISLVFIEIGLLMGVTCNQGMISGIGTLLVNLCTFMSGAWFSLKMVGGAFETIGYIFPFAHAVDAAREVISGTGFDAIHLIPLLLYPAVFGVISVIIFTKKQKIN